MPAMMSRFRTEDEQGGLCPCCRVRQTVSIRYHPKSGMPYIWLCENIKCMEAKERIYAMSDRDYEENVEKALWIGGQAGGAYLDKIGKTDLATLTNEEYLIYLKTILRHMEEEMLKNVEKSFDSMRSA